MIGDTGCCGAHFKEDTNTILGLATFSLPIVLLCSILIPGLTLIGGLSPRIKKIREVVVIVITANLDLIRRAPLAPRLRCAAASKIFSFSPELSGIIYRCFNISTLILLWTGLILSFYVIALFWGCIKICLAI